MKHFAWAAVLLFSCLFVATDANSQAPAKTNPDAERKIAEIMKDLPSGSSLSQRLTHGARGDGVHHAWMSDMQRQSIRRILVLLRISFNHSGRPKTLAIESIEYFADYDGRQQIKDGVRLTEIRTSGLEKEMADLALERAKHGAWLDVPRPRPRPFIGAAVVEFFDNEWLPVFQSPLYCAGPACFVRPTSDN